MEKLAGQKVATTYFKEGWALNTGKFTLSQINLE